MNPQFPFLGLRRTEDPQINPKEKEMVVGFYYNCFYLAIPYYDILHSQQGGLVCNKEKAFRQREIGAKRARALRRSAL